MKPGGKQGLFLRIEEFARQRYRLVFLVSLLFVLVSIYLGSRLSLDGDVMNLVPANNRVVNTFKGAIRDFGGLDYLILLVEAREGQGTEDLQEFADLAAARLQGIPSIRYVEYKVDTSGPFFSFFRKNQILFLPPARLDELAARFGDKAIHERVRDNARQLTGPSSFLVKQLLAQDPFLISPLLFEAVLRNKGALKVDVNGGYYLAKDGNALLVIAKPVKPAQDISFDKKLMQQVTAEVALASEAFERERREETRDDGARSGGRTDGSAEGDGAEGGPAGESAQAPHVSYGGGYVIALEDSQLIMQDMVRNGTLSFVVILLLYYFCYRRFGAILYSSVPLVVGQFLTIAVAFIFLRHLNSATTGFSAMLMGLGTDFTIVMYARYVEERQRGRSLAEALRLMMGATGFGVFTGAITSAGTFYAMCTTDYKGLRDFGFLVGSGILLCLVAILYLLPAMISWNEGRRRRKDVTSKLYLHSFGIERVMTWSTRYPWPVIAGSILVTAVAGYYAWNVEFSDNVQDLRSRNNRGILVQEDIARKFGGASFNPMMVVCRGADLEEVMRKSREANHRLDAFVTDGTLLGYESIFTYLPPRLDQETIIRTLRDGSNGAFNIDRISRTFRAALRESGFREGIYDEYLGALPATLRPERAVTLHDLESAGLDHFVSRYVKREENGGYRSVTYVFPAAAEAKRHAPPALVRALDRPEEGVEVTGVNIASAELRRIFRHDAWCAVIYGLVLVTFLLWLDFRSLWLTTLANIQLLLGVVWMLAAMQLLGIKMNFVNAFVTTMILGVGIDYGIHIIHRISQEGLSNPTGLLETGKAVVMAALTNVAGFGTVGLSNYPGLASMGIVSAIGSVTCLVTALTTLPALLILTKTRVTRSRDRHDD
ncbi:MAG TPA: MMPL family transporter [Candidatus Polarisedimenticolia bacterium]|nr:MMPL family transporter [Candidatus Polarisedimenticolia bacterium]